MYGYKGMTIVTWEKRLYWDVSVFFPQKGDSIPSRSPWHRNQRHVDNCFLPLLGTRNTLPAKWIVDIVGRVPSFTKHFRHLNWMYSKNLYFSCRDTAFVRAFTHPKNRLRFSSPLSELRVTLYRSDLVEQTTPAYLAIEESFVNMVMNRCPRLTYRHFCIFKRLCLFLQFQANASRQYWFMMIMMWAWLWWRW